VIGEIPQRAGVVRHVELLVERRRGELLLATNLLDLTPNQLRELASGPSALGAISNRLFEGKHRKHLFCVAFVSPADMRSEARDIYDASSRGMALWFRREEHPLSHDPRLVLFQRRAPSNALEFLERLPFWTVRARYSKLD
jgi:hypothetical protein